MTEQQGMTFIVKTITRFVITLIVLFGIYIILYGHLTPGGGFAGGVIVATGYILLVLAFGREFTTRYFKESTAHVLDCLGAFAFATIALLGFTGGYFFYNFIAHGTEFRLFSAGIIPLCNIAIGIKVLACLFGIFVTLAVFGRMVSEMFPQSEEESPEEEGT